MHGKGIYTVKGRVGGAKDPTGKAGVHVFEGEYVLGARQGHGSIKYANTITFQGEFKESRCAGRGKLVFPNGDVYEGDFEKDLPHGTGRYTFANGSVYEGEFSKGKMNGEGEFVFPEGAGYDNDEYLLPGMSIPEKLRIQGGGIKGAAGSISGGERNGGCGRVRGSEVRGRRCEAGGWKIQRMRHWQAGGCAVGSSWRVRRERSIDRTSCRMAWLPPLLFQLFQAGI